MTGATGMSLLELSRLQRTECCGHHSFLWFQEAEPSGHLQYTQVLREFQSSGPSRIVGPLSIGYRMVNWEISTLHHNTGTGARPYHVHAHLPPSWPQMPYITDYKARACMAGLLGTPGLSCPMFSRPQQKAYSWFPDFRVSIQFIDGKLELLADF